MRKPDFTIGHPSAPYMLRWFTFPRNNWFNIYWHKFLRDDEDRALHDHPWPSLSIVLSGGYYEITKGPDGTNERRWFGAWSIIPRRPSHTHRVELARDADGNVLPCWTLFICGPRLREWGFHCPQGWRHWKEFVDHTDHGNVGRGCE